jgi:hypothetical protein
MADRREYLKAVPLRVSPVVRHRAERALELGLIDPSNYVKAALSLEPIIDVLQDEDAAMRIAMIALLTERGDGTAAALLAHMTHDPEDYVRTHAAQGLERIDARHRQRIAQAEQAAGRQSEPSAWAAVAEAHLAMARLRPEVPVLCDFHLQRADSALERALQAEARVEWMVLHAELQALARQTAEAEATARAVLERRPMEPRALLLLAGLAFEHGRYDQVRRYCERLAGAPDLQPEVVDMIAFWTGEAGRVPDRA